MPVRKFRSVEEMEQEIWRQNGDPALYRAMSALWRSGDRSNPPACPPGVHKFRSLEEMSAFTERWKKARFDKR